MSLVSILCFTEFFLFGKCIYRRLHILYVFILVRCWYLSFICFCFAPTDVSTLTPPLNACGCMNVCVLCPLQAEDTDMRLSLPECHPSRYPLLTLAKDYQNVKLPPDMFMPGETQGAPPPKPTKSRWRKITHAEWVKPGNYMLFLSRCGQKVSVIAKSRVIHHRNTDSHQCLGKREMLPRQ